MMDSWRETVLAELAAGAHPLALVADPDGLLADEAALVELDGRGYDVVVYVDPVEFRYSYESRYRYAAPGDGRALAVVVRGDANALRQLPYDLLQRGRAVNLSLTSLFPNLSYNVLRALPAPDLDRLLAAQAQLKSASLGENATRDFALRHVYGISPEMIRGDAELLGALLNLHLSGRQLPRPLAERLVAQLSALPGVTDWPLLPLLTDAGALLGFLQERWPVFLDRLAAEQAAGAGEPAVREPRAYDLEWPGEAHLPFDAPQVWPLVDTLFLEGRLRPVAHPQAERLASLRVAVGLRRDAAAERRARLARLLKQLAGRLPNAAARHQEWLAFAPLWAEAAVLRAGLGGADEVHAAYQALEERVDTAFQAWLLGRYQYLATQSAAAPVMVHRIAHALARELANDPKARVALVVLDGLALPQWLLAREALGEQLPGARFEESATFAWIPTITSVSRQAIFAGSPPSGFANTIRTTNAEASLWTAFWETNGLRAAEVGYERALRGPADLARVAALTSQARVRAVGLVVDQVDQLLHGSKLGAKGLHQQVRLWLEGGFLAELIRALQGAGFRVVLTADHGNVSARGIGAPNEQSLADTRGQRARVYPNETLRDAVWAGFPDALAWPPRGLPDGYWPLLAPGRAAFAPRDQEVITHGGAALEEVIVPYIRVREGTA